MELAVLVKSRLRRWSYATLAVLLADRGHIDSGRTLLLLVLVLPCPELVEGSSSILRRPLQLGRQWPPRLCSLISAPSRRDWLLGLDAVGTRHELASGQTESLRRAAGDSTHLCRPADAGDHPHPRRYARPVTSRLSQSLRLPPDSSCPAALGAVRPPTSGALPTASASPAFVRSRVRSRTPHPVCALTTR